MSDTKPITYADAGVSIDAGNALVRAIAPVAAATRRPGADVHLGGFGAFFDLRAAGYTDPVLVACTDGVGTKVKLAAEAGNVHSVGIDLVAMSVNDLIVQGAEPLFFLDYFATGKLDPVMGAAIVAGVAEGCRQAGCALIGGETAEMPGIYAAGDFDLAGFAVGAVERGQHLKRESVQPGQVLLGLASSGVHANGFSLVRRIMAAEGLSVASPAPFDPGQTLGDALLVPTRIYVSSLLPLIRAGQIKALAHITGGGLTENVPRVLPEGVEARIDASAWTLPPVFAWARDAARLPPQELVRTLNCGIGMVVVVDADVAAAVADALTAAGETVYRIGTLEPGQPGLSACRVHGAAGVWAYPDPWDAAHAG